MLGQGSWVGKYYGSSGQAQYNHKCPNKKEAESQELEKGTVIIEAETLEDI